MIHTNAKNPQASSSPEPTAESAFAAGLPPHHAYREPPCPWSNWSYKKARVRRRESSLIAAQSRDRSPPAADSETLSAKFADKSKRGRPPSIGRRSVVAIFSDAKSYRSQTNKMSMVRVAQALGERDRGLYDWFERKLTAMYALGHLPPHLIHPAASEIRNENMSCAEAVRYCRDLKLVLDADMVQP